MQHDSWASSPRARAVMKGNRSRDTKPEILIRKSLHARGFRFRVGIRPIPRFPRTADILFTRQRIAVFVDGCFWHGCPEHYVPSKTNREYWDEKVRNNVIRDQETSTVLSNAGWTVLRFWGHEDSSDVATKIASVVRQLRSLPG